MAKTGTFVSIAENQDGKLPTIVTPANPLPIKSGLGDLVTDAWAQVRPDSLIEQNSTMTGVNTLLMEKFATIRVSANDTRFRDNPSPETIDYFLTQKDHIVMVVQSGNNVDIDATIEYGEEI